MNVLNFAQAAKPRAQPITAFEREVARAFAVYKGNSAFDYLFVTLDYDGIGPYNAAKKSEPARPSSLHLFPLDRGDDPLHAVDLIHAAAAFGISQSVIMVLDLHGKGLAEQITTWRTGLTPEIFVENPLLSLHKRNIPTPPNGPALRSV